MHERRVVAGGFTLVGGGWDDQAWGRAFQLGPRDGYYYRGFTVRDFRRQGAMTLLLRYMMADNYERFGVERAFVFVRAVNRTMMEVFRKLGWRPCGHVGLVSLFDVRLHYLTGQAALPATRARVYLDPGFRHADD